MPNNNNLENESVQMRNTQARLFQSENCLVNRNDYFGIKKENSSRSGKE